MKNKILFSTLLGGALLASCTADDALEMNKVAEEVNSAAPVFTVSFGDDELTRAEMDNDGMTWDIEDVMSLYHGGNSASGDFFSGGVMAFQRNAIYAYDTTDGDAAKFSTQSMVLPGSAVMIFPADTTFANTANANPVISLTNEQNETTRNLTPYISEVLDLQKLTDQGENKDYSSAAGYGREYKIEMRRIGAQLRLALEPVNGKVDGIEFRKVAISVDNGTSQTANPFTTALEIKVGQLRNNVDTEVENELVGTNPEGYESWKYSPWIEPLGAASLQTYKENTISTTDIATLNGAEAAYFTLLPPEDRDNSVLGESKKLVDGIDAFKEPTFGNATITVYTNYGKVELTETNDTKNEDGLWRKGNTKMTMRNGIAEFLTVAFPAAKEDRPKYRGQLVAAKGTRYLTVDVSKLDMKGLHIANQGDLEKVLTVYDNSVKGGENDEVTFVLDGEKSGDYKGKFVMNKKTWSDLETRFADKDNHVNFALCDDEAPCSAVVLIDEDGTVNEVPALKLVNSANGEKVKATTAIELVGNWTYSKITENKNGAEGAKAKVKALDVNNLIVKSGANLKLADYIAATGNVTIEVENGATADVTNVVTLQLDLNNKGTLNITEDGGQLAVDKDAKLVNLEPQGKDATGWQKDIKKGGVINLKGTLAIVDKTNGEINNYGMIDIQSTTARLLMTANGTEGADAGKPFTNTDQATDQRPRNVFGVIYLTQNVGKSQVKINKAESSSESADNKKAYKGFIKRDDAKGDVANYVVLKNSSWVAADYVEIDNEKDVVKPEIGITTAGATLDILIVPAKTSIFCDQTVTVNKDLYVKGSITHTGNFTYKSDNVFTGYFAGGNVNDKTRIFSWGE